MPLDVVLDTNVLIAGLRSKLGASFRVLEAIAAGQVRNHVSVALALEYEDVLKRRDLLPHLTPIQIDHFLNYMFSLSVLVPRTTPRRPVLRDPDDDRILEVAVETGAVVITHNVRDFAESDRVGVRAMTPRVLLETLEERK